MYEHDATETAYKNGYEKGYAAALAAIGYAKKLSAEEPVQVTLTMMCSRCRCLLLEHDHVCPGCGAIFAENKNASEV